MAEKTLTKEEKAKLIAKVREKKLTPDLQPLFDEYCSGRNPQLNKRLQNSNTEWEKVLNNWKGNKTDVKQESKRKVLKNPKTILSKIGEEIKANTFDSLQSAIDYCHDLINILEGKQVENRKKEIEKNKAEIAKLQAENKALEEANNK